MLEWTPEPFAQLEGAFLNVSGAGAARFNPLLQFDNW
jgi:hypothetical protein